MNKLLALAAMAALLAGCANPHAPELEVAEVPQFEADGAAVAAELGYHGPPRATQRMGAGPAQPAPSR